MSVDRLAEAGVDFTEILMAPLAEDPQEIEEYSRSDSRFYEQFIDGEHEMTEGVEISFSDMPCEECPEERDLRIEETAEYAGTREQFN